MKLHFNRMTIQLIIAIIIIIVGISLLYIGIFSEPQGEIDYSIVTTFGEILTFAGALIGIDYSYKHKKYVIDKEN